MKKTAFLFILMALLLCDGKAQNIVYPGDTTGRYFIPHFYALPAGSGTQSGVSYTPVMSWMHQGTYYYRQFLPSNTVVYGAALGAEFCDGKLRENVYVYLYTLVGDVFVAIDSARVDTCTPNKLLYVPCYEYGSTMEGSPLTDTLLPLLEVYFSHGHDFSSSGFALAVGTPSLESYSARNTCNDTNHHGIIYRFLTIHHGNQCNDTIDDFFHYANPAQTDNGIAHTYGWVINTVFPIISHDMWMDHIQSTCNPVGKPRASVYRDNTALRWTSSPEKTLHEYAYGNALSAPDSYFSDTTSTDSITLGGIPCNTNLAFRVRSLCSWSADIETWSDWSDTVQFRCNRYHVAATCNDSSLGLVTGTDTLFAGDTATVEATPYDGCIFAAWDNGDTCNPAVFTVSRDTTLTALFVRILSVGTTATNNVVISPNPTKGDLHVDAGEDIAEIIIHNLQGKLVSRIVPMSRSTVVNTSSWPAGTYIISVKTTSGTTTRKLVLE